MFKHWRDVIYCLRQSWVSGSKAAISNEEICHKSQNKFMLKLQQNSVIWKIYCIRQPKNSERFKFTNWLK
ncbi:hypothetical protein BpHYR1_038432 [Brachionus plicatilis]|uniref:Uncharacterized protein n=1 Tax=Brachionus plicatilis TaxID=10195 RepID=A0A3M7Q0Y7_BRAPC|nr:hypothetical protein BpHYR1_038432 [Brachionus plicatilis]